MLWIKRIALCCVVVILPLAFVACDDDETARITLTGTVQDLTTDDPMAGVTVCILEPKGYGCTDTNASGVASIQAPVNTDLLLSYTSDTYYSALAYYTTGDQDETLAGHFSMVTEVEADVAAGLVGVVPDDTKGHVSVYIRDSASTTDGTWVAGVTIAMDSAAGGTRWYIDQDGDPSKEIESSTNRGITGIVNVEPGDWTLTATHATKTCEPYIARGTGTANAFEAQVKPEHLTVLYLICR